LTAITMDSQVRMQMVSASARSDRFSGVIDLGLEPAIEADGRRHTAFDRKRVSTRWLAGTILTGLSGAGLIGAAAYAALDHQSYFAEAPSPAAPPRRDTADVGTNPRKADRLVKSVDIIAAKQNFRAPVPIKVGDKEVVKIHSFTHVKTTLSLTTVGFADEVPAFNPLKLLADARNPIDVPPEPVQDDAEVSWATRDFMPQNVSPAVALSIDEVRAQVAEHIKNTLAAGSQNQAVSLPPQLLLTRTSRANLGPALAYANPNELVSNPFSSIEVRMVPENVSIIPRADDSSQQATQMQERLVTVNHGETLEDVLRAQKVPADQIAKIVAAFNAKHGDPVVAEGRRLKLLFADLDGTNRQETLARLSVYAGETLEATIAITDKGEYLRVATAPTAPRKPTDAASTDEEDDDDSGAMRLYDSLYETALKQEIPQSVIDNLVRIFANDVDFQRAVRGGDSFDAFYDESDESDGHPELLYASITARGETYHYYRYQTPDDSIVDYYDQNGRSTRKFLVRVPIVSGKITSGFGMRFHPILGYTRPHTGVDWAAPIGTPIFAAGNGTIISEGWDSGYGRRIEIQHANGYVTTYNHMSGFARGTGEGVRVRQGQVIGYLGQTGLATGPHLHYEVLVNGHFVDPMKVKLARTREFDGPMLAQFKREKDRIDALLAKAPNAPQLVAVKQNNDRPSFSLSETPNYLVGK
jgi:murein DD-endopeptidase MepM/ murein hydrolase activator NlpD